MIPLRLTLHNFLCYRDPDPLDFSGLHLACLAGNNGHGKSALLDAMTWALWGRARSNQADDLIHLGESDMWVDLEFALEGQRYRVIRSRERRGRSGKSDLQLQVLGADGDYRPISEPTIRQTEQHIIDLLRMDYDTFISSAFLLQGRADEFTVKPPNQRKQVLADILGLGRYDIFELRARDRAREKRDEAGRVEAQIEAIDRELAQEAAYLEALQAAQAQVLDLGERLRAAEEQQRSLYLEQQDLLARRRALEDVRRQLGRGEQELAEIQTQLQRDRASLALARRLLETREEIEAGYRHLVASRQQDQAWNRKLAQQADLQARQGRLDQEIAHARSQLESEQRIVQERLRRLQAEAEQVADLEGQIGQARAQLAAVAQQEERLAALRERIQSLAAENASLATTKQRLSDDMEDIKEKLDLLAGSDVACPVCGQALGELERARVIEGYRQQGKDLGDQFRSHQAHQKEILEEGREAEAQLKEHERAVATRTRWERQEAQAEAQLRAARLALEELAAAQDELEKVRERLATRDYAAQAQAERVKLDADLEALGYDPQAHEQVRDDLLHYEPFQERYGQLQAALSRLDDLESRIAELQVRQERWQQSLAADQERRDELATAVAGLPQVQSALQAQSAEVQRLAAADQRARQELGAAQQRLDACQALAAQRQGLTRQVEELREAQACYEELQAAFGKKGLQAMIIEAAIPEIEREANNLLNRMSDGRMSVRLETQRETKTTQELRETLDILLSDELGTRDYSLFSGGEAYRANFAIRIALSKLLARRAGAQLQTLIIDEGFGTQDAQGRERLVEAITSIQDDFERILVITHIDELKDHFPARIEVVKTAEGSQISLA